MPLWWFFPFWAVACLVVAKADDDHKSTKITYGIKHSHKIVHVPKVIHEKKVLSVPKVVHQYKLVKSPKYVTEEKVVSVPKKVFVPKVVSVPKLIPILVEHGETERNPHYLPQPSHQHYSHRSSHTPVAMPSIPVHTHAMPLLPHHPAAPLLFFPFHG